MTVHSVNILSLGLGLGLSLVLPTSWTVLVKKTQSSILYILTCILTITQHTEEMSQKIMYSEWQKKRMGEKFRVEMNRQKAGEPPDKEFEWQREFHLLISPLNSHNHAIGEVSVIIVQSVIVFSFLMIVCKPHQKLIII